MLRRRVVDLEPTESLDHREPLWQDAIVFVLAGELAVECPDGDRHCFRAGDILTLARLPILHARNNGNDRTRLLAIWRKKDRRERWIAPAPRISMPNDSQPNRERTSNMSATIVSYTVKSGREEENAELVQAVFEELAAATPAGFRYAVFQASDSREFIHLYMDEGAPSGTLQQLPSFQAFVADAEDRHEQPAAFEQFDLIGAYRTYGNA